jgi:soluble lytic murein transglycosylase-like protein
MLSDPQTVISMKHFSLAAPARPERYLTAPPQAHPSLSYFFRLVRACQVTRGVVDLAATLLSRSSRCAKRGANPRTALAPVFAMLMSFGALAHVDDPNTTVARSVTLRKQAVAYEHGEGVQKDPAKAIALYCEAARLGDGAAQFNLGWMYANGRGVARDDALAAYFFRAAAAQGDEHARNMLRRVGEPVARTPQCMREKALAQIGVVREFVATSAGQKKVVDLVKQLAPEYRINPHLALAVIRAESGFNAKAQSPKNAQGLMQLIPETSARFNVKKPFDPVQNIRGGLAYLRWLLAYFKGDVALVAAAYNAGEGAVDRHRGIPPYPETRAYVKRILQLFQDDAHPYDAKVTDPSPELPRMRKVELAKLD